MSIPEADGACPRCGSTELVAGYGLAFGRGIGSYTACDGCGWYQKGLDPDMYTPEEIAAGGEPGPICMHGQGSDHDTEA